MIREHRGFFFALVALAGTACLEHEQTVYRFDLASKSGAISFVDLRSDSAESALTSLGVLVEGYLHGPKLQEKLPRLRLGEARLVANEERLDGVVAFTFETPESVGVYQVERRGPLMYCVPHGEVVIETNGESIEAVLPGCVIWPRRSTQLDLTTRSREDTPGEPDESASLRPVYEQWVAAGSPPAIEDAPFFQAIVGERRLEQLFTNVDAIREQELTHGRVHLSFLAMPPTPRPVDSLDGEPIPWPEDSDYRGLHWTPEQRHAIYGSYWVEVSEGGEDFTVHGVINLDGGDQPIHATANRAQPAALLAL
jgi:hypothetical protein